MVGNERNNNWIAGLVLIGLGLVFLVQNITGVQLGNWWALFILMPAVWAFWNAWEIYQKEGKLTPQAARMAQGGLFPLVIGLIFLFNLDFGRLWPLLLVIAGIGAILNPRNPEKPSDPNPPDQGSIGYR
ncbi:MAG: hypothetical protein SFU83_08580 [Meiothermus sp.]|nr:hypothetical protein [Meiothermus sp.]